MKTIKLIYQDYRIQGLQGYTGFRNKVFTHLS